MIEPLEERKYTYHDYLQWDTMKRYELIDGSVFMMASPSPNHQRISLKLSRLFGNFLEGKPCEVFSAPLDVRLFPQKDLKDDTVVQPDLMVICDRNKLDKRGCNGAPDLVIEILSPSNNPSEMFLKFHKYLRAGIQEYWVINPDERAVQIHLLDNGQYISRVYEEDDSISVSILPGFKIDLETLWSVLE